MEWSFVSGRVMHLVGIQIRSSVAGASSHEPGSAAPEQSVHQLKLDDDALGRRKLENLKNCDSESE